MDSLIHDVVVILKPSVGKAVAVYRPFVTDLQRMREQKARSLVDPSTGKLVDPLTGEFLRSSAWDELSATEQLELSTQRANARAASEMSDFMVHNRLVKMWVLTFANELQGITGRAEAMRLTALFMRRLRRTFFRDKPFPYVYSPELHPDGHGWHVNVFLRDTFINKHQFQRLWGHGNVWFTDFTKDRFASYTGRKIGAVRAGASSSGSARAARKAAVYASKYASKDWAVQNIGKGAHRYERAEGFGVPELRFRVRTFSDFATALRQHPAVGSIFVEWNMAKDSPGWMGPPMMGFLFDHGAPASRVKGSRKQPAFSPPLPPSSSRSWLPPPLEAAESS
jgi:hypothetical protein